jgi:hypothetical protein
MRLALTLKEVGKRRCALTLLLASMPWAVPCLALATRSTSSSWCVARRERLAPACMHDGSFTSHEAISSEACASRHNKDDGGARHGNGAERAARTSSPPLRQAGP